MKYNKEHSMNACMCEDDNDDGDKATQHERVHDDDDDDGDE